MTKGIVIYYSQTGNTKRIAEAITAGMKKAIEECNMKTLKEVTAEDLTRYDLIGLGYPTWSSKEPPNVRAFIEQTIALEGKHIFISVRMEPDLPV